MKLEFDTESSPVYMSLREGRAEQTLDLAELGFGTFGIDGEGKVLGDELLSLRHGDHNPVWRRS